MKELRPWLRNYLPEAERTFDHFGTHEEVVHLKEIVSVYFCSTSRASSRKPVADCEWRDNDSAAAAPSYGPNGGIADSLEEAKFPQAPPAGGRDRGWRGSWPRVLSAGRAPWERLPESRHLFPKNASLFLPVILVLDKSSKSLIPQW